MLGLCFCVRAFSSCGKWGPLFIAVRGPLTVAAHGLQTRRLSSCGSRVQLLCGMCDLSRPGLEPVSPALAGRFSTSVPPGKPPGKTPVRTLKLFLYGIVTLGLLGSCYPRSSLGKINLGLAMLLLLELSILTPSPPNSKPWRLGVPFAFRLHWTS